MHLAVDRLEWANGQSYRASCVIGKKIFIEPLHFNNPTGAHSYAKFNHQFGQARAVNQD